MNINIAVPTISGLSKEFSNQLEKLSKTLEAQNNKVLISVQENCAWVQISRNRLVDNFYSINFDKLLFIDDDIFFETEDVLALLKVDVDVCAGAYRRKFAGVSFAVSVLSKDIQPNKCVIASEVPAGMLCISREAVKSLRTVSQPYTLDGKENYNYFPQGIYDG